MIACTVAGELSEAYALPLLPPVMISCSQEHAAWTGTVSISAATLAAVVTDIAASLRRSGITRLALVNGHGGNYVLANLVQESMGAMALFPSAADWDEARAAAAMETMSDADMHAGELETSILLYGHPDVVRAGYAATDHDANDRRHMLTIGLDAYTTNGVVGRPSLGTPEKGRAAVEHLTSAFSGCLAALTDKAD